MTATPTQTVASLQIYWEHSPIYGHMVLYGNYRSSFFNNRCVTRKFGLGLNEAKVIVDALDLIGDTDMENIEARFRIAKKVAVRGFERIKGLRYMNRLPNWTPEQFANEITFAAMDAIEGKGIHFKF